MQQIALPRRMAAAFVGMFAKQTGAAGLSVIDEILNRVERVPLSGDIGAIHRAAESAARECYRIMAQFKTDLAIKIHLDVVCLRLGVGVPIGKDDAEIFKKAVDKNWWFANLQKEFKRRLEHAAICTGITYKTNDAYISREAAMFQREQNKRNQKLLEQTRVTNGAQEFALSDLAALGMANKTLRRGELMTRMRGFEEMAMELNHTAMFWTITCPSKFHAVGGTNKKYNGATPRQSQAYLQKIWSRMRAKMNREGIYCYGFRIAEPHSDGCPHWHMVLFVERKQAQRTEAIIKAYALAEDAGEWEEEENRVKLVNIDTSNGGSAAAYIAKYIAKNIDGFGVGDHKTFENGETYIIKTDLFGNEELTASQRVTYWSQVWGIRQFQQIGGAPVTVWRELRRVPEDGIHLAPYEIQEAWHACQKSAKQMTVNGILAYDDKGEPVMQASFSDYLKAQGGAFVGRNYRIKIKSDLVIVDGKYSVNERMKPIGIYAVSEAETIYKSTRYTWTKVESAAAVGFGGTRTGVNNCTQPEKEPFWKTTKYEPKNKIFSSDVDEFIDGWRKRE